MELEVNTELDLAWEYVTKTSMNIFLTGKAGTGKTTFLKRVVRECPKPKVVLAPTGVAAINAGGMTLHSFFQLPFGLFLPEFQHVQAHDKEGRYKFHKKKLRLIRSIELMIIDEVSMLRADVMDELDALLRKLRRSEKPFGGVQVLMIGDVQQLAPVVKEEEWAVMKNYYASPYFFDAKVLKTNPYRLVELTQIFRQRESEFIDILSAVRENRMTQSLLAKLNQRYQPDYVAPEGCITLCTHNRVAKDINDGQLAAIHAPEFVYTASIEGNFPENMYPQDVDLILKKGAQVMFTKNDPNPEKMYVNGTLGKVVYLDDDHITVALASGEEVEVEPLPWENLKYEINEETKEIVSAIDGLFTQYPLKTAWAITIHKSQGLTFDQAVIDAGRSFTHGQVYVALSRCRTLDGIVLKQKISPYAIIEDQRVDQFSDYVSESLPSAEDLSRDQRAYFAEVVRDLYDFERLRKYYYTYFKFIRFTFEGIFPKALQQWKESEGAFKEELAEVGDRFVRSLGRIIGEDYQESEFLQERITKASNYFFDKALEVMIPLVKVTSGVDFDDKQKKKLNQQYFTNFMEALFQKLFLWNFTREGFVLTAYIKERSALSGEIPEIKVSKLLALLRAAGDHPGESFLKLAASRADRDEAMGEESSAKRADTDEEDEDILNPDLFEKLRLWRCDKAAERQVPAYMILRQKALIAIVNSEPTTKAEMLSIKGVGRAFMTKYGNEVLAIIHNELGEDNSGQLLF